MNLLYLIEHKYFQKKMSRGARFHTWEAISKHPDVKMSLMTGPGFPDFPGSIMDLNPDYVLAYKPLDCEWHPTKAPLILNYNEMWDEEWTVTEIEQSGANMVICHHENDFKKYENTIQGVKFVHIPHGVSEWRFEVAGQRELACRPISALFSGVFSPQFYPVRAKLKHVVDQVPNSKVLSHPGYRLEDVIACEEQFKRYVDHLSWSRVSLCCTSRYKYSLNKLHESIAAGCVVFSDLPHDGNFNAKLGKYIQEVGNSESIGSITERVKHVCDSPSEFQVMTTEARQVVLDEFGHNRYAERFLSACRSL